MLQLLRNHSKLVTKIIKYEHRLEGSFERFKATQVRQLSDVLATLLSIIGD
jgi:hypothetical protein